MIHDRLQETDDKGSTVMRMARNSAGPRTAGGSSDRNLERHLILERTAALRSFAVVKLQITCCVLLVFKTLYRSLWGSYEGTHQKGDEITGSEHEAERCPGMELPSPTGAELLLFQDRLHSSQISSLKRRLNNNPEF